MKRVLAFILIPLVLCLCGCEIAQPLVSIFSSTPTGDAVDLLESLERIYDGRNAVEMALHTADGSVYGPYTAFELPEDIHLEGYLLEKEPNLNGYDTWLTVESESTRASLTVYYGFRDLFCFTYNGERYYYRDSGSNPEETLQREFYIMEFLDKRSAEFASELHTADAVLRKYANTVYPQLQEALSPDSVFRLDQYDLMDYSLLESTDTTIVGTITYTAKPANENSTAAQHGEPLEGKEYEGMLLFTETVTLEKAEDGHWHRVFNA